MHKTRNAVECTDCGMVCAFTIIPDKKPRLSFVLWFYAS